MTNLINELTTRTGFRFQVRQAQPSDTKTLAEFFTHVTPDDLRFRFMEGLKEVGPDLINMLASVDHNLVENFLAFDPLDGSMIATGMLACTSDRARAEVAMAVHEDYKRRGVSWELLQHITEFAKKKGVKILESIESPQNNAAIVLEREMGFTAVRDPDDPSFLILRKALN